MNYVFIPGYIHISVYMNRRGIKEESPRISHEQSPGVNLAVVWLMAHTTQLTPCYDLDLSIAPPSDNMIIPSLNTPGKLPTLPSELLKSAQILLSVGPLSQAKSCH